MSSEKKEKLERAIRYKLEIESRRLQQQNRDLKSCYYITCCLLTSLTDGLLSVQLESAMAHISKRPVSQRVMSLFTICDNLFIFHQLVERKYRRQWTQRRVWQTRRFDRTTPSTK